MSEAAVSTTELRESIHEVLAAESDWSQFASLGWFGLAVPEEYGGLGLGLPHLAVLYEELGQFLTPLPVMTTLLASASIAACASPDQKKHWLARLAAGEIRASLALPTSAVSLPRIHDNAVNGEVADVLYGDSVDELLVPLQDDAGQLHLAIIQRSGRGVETNARPIIDLTRTLAQIRLSNVEIAPERLLPLDATLWSGILDHLCVAIACDAVGGASRILADTVKYLSERQQFGRPIGSFQALKHRLATWKIQLEGITALTRYSADLVQDNDPTRSGRASAAKASATETYLKIAGDAVQLHGGIGFTWEHECHLYLKRAALDAALFGGVIQHKDRAAHFTFGADSGLTGQLQHEPLRRFFS